MIRFRNVSYTYPGAMEPAIQDITLDIPAGEIVLVIGPSGSGKSTLLRCVNGLVPHFSGGTLHGEIQVNGLDPVTAAPHRMSRSVGFVFQDPETQFVVDRVEDEIAFALENAALPLEDMRTRVGEVLDLLDLTPLRNRTLETLSGGERQRVAIATVLAFRPQVLVLDEPTSQLAPQSAEEVLQTLKRLNREMGLTVLVSEHRLERVLPFTDRLIYLEEGRPGALTGPPRQVLRHIELQPPLVELGKALGWDPLPLTIEEGKSLLESFQCKPVQVNGDEVGKLRENQSSNHRISTAHPYLQARDVDVNFGSYRVLREVNLDLWPGEILVLLGPNGAGKTTLLRTLVGLVRPQKGNVLIGGQDISARDVADVCRQVGYLPQDPNALLFADTVLDELMITLRNHKMPAADLRSRELLARFGLSDQVDCYPRDLSVGQRQRVALGAIMVTRPGALLLDEPTRGMDYASKQVLSRILQEWRKDGEAILLVTHDVELAAVLADRVALIEAGQIVDEGPPVDVLGNSEQFATQVARLFPGRGWLTPGDVIQPLN